MNITSHTTDTEIIRNFTTAGRTDFQGVRKAKAVRDSLLTSVKAASGATVRSMHTTLMDRPLAVKALEAVVAAMEVTAKKAAVVARLQAGKKRKKVERAVSDYFARTYGVV